MLPQTAACVIALKYGTFILFIISLDTLDRIKVQNNLFYWLSKRTVDWVISI